MLHRIVKRSEADVHDCVSHIANAARVQDFLDVIVFNNVFNNGISNQHLLMMLG
jgi:hypothetical protein